MAEKRTGISRDLIIHPGETIADVLEARRMTQADLAVRTGVSPVFIGKVIAGKKDISNKFAMALEYALGISKTFWLNLQARYNAEILEADEENTITDEELNVQKILKDIVKYLGDKNIIPQNENLTESILSLRKVLKVSNLCNLEKIPTLSAFRINTTSTVNPCILGAWIRMCQIKEGDLTGSNTFDPQNVDALISELKDVMLSDDKDIQSAIKSVLYRYGLDFEIIRHFRGAPVQGFIYKRADSRIKICMTIRRSFADIFWFSLFHELGHLYNGDLSRSSHFLDDGIDKRKEDAADKFASDKLMDSTEYSNFLSLYRKAPSFELIERFAAQQRVRPFIVIGRMQKEEIISYQQYSNAKLRYKWAE